MNNLYRVVGCCWVFQSLLLMSIGSILWPLGITCATGFFYIAAWEG